MFTAFADTAQYLYAHLAQWAHSELGIHTALVTGGGTNKTTMAGLGSDLNNILTAFSPVSKERSKVDPTATTELDLLIATDCISEGQNLQDCDTLINYDIHWNPVRIIQRFGRIDRLGSKTRKSSSSTSGPTWSWMNTSIWKRVSRGVWCCWIYLQLAKRTSSMKTPKHE